MIALLEYEWLTGKSVIGTEAVEQTSALLLHDSINIEKAEYCFWLQKAGRQRALNNERRVEGYDSSSTGKALAAAAFWERCGSPYEQALLLFEGNDDHKRTAIAMVQALGAAAVFEKLKQEMKQLGIANIPRGIRASTRSNAAFLTGRELEILYLLKDQLQNKEIAQRLFISAKTVDHHISSILFKLDATSRSKAVAAAVKMGILK